MNKVKKLTLLIFVIITVLLLNNLVLSSDKPTSSLLNKPAPKLSYLITYSQNNIQPEILTNLKNKVHLVFFWSSSDWDSIGFLPELNRFYETYQNAGLEIIACQSPGYQFEIDNGEILSDIKNYAIKFPVIIDNGWKSYRAYGNTTWPIIYLTDRAGIIKKVFDSDIKHQDVEAAIKALLNEPQI